MTDNQPDEHLPNKAADVEAEISNKERCNLDIEQENNQIIERPRLKVAPPRGTFDEITEYTNGVQDALKDNIVYLDEFWNVLAAYRRGQIDPQATTNRVKILLVDHPDLVLGLEVCLPEGFVMDMQSQLIGY